MATTTDPSNPADAGHGLISLFSVDAEEVAAVLALPVPAHETVFDEARFHDLVARSFSITLAEKAEMIRSLAEFSQEQLETLTRLFTDERQKFQELNERHARRLAELNKESAAHDAEGQILVLFGSR